MRLEHFYEGAIRIPFIVSGGPHYRYFNHRHESKQDALINYVDNVIPTGHGNSCDTPYRGIVKKDGWKYVCTEASEWLLFNLNEDPYEERNLAMNTMFLQKRHELHAKLTRWIRDTEDSFELPPVYEYRR